MSSRPWCCACRGCVTASRTCRCSRGTSSRGTRRDAVSSRRCSRRTSSRRSPRPAGRATFASSSAPASASSRRAPAARCVPDVSPRRIVSDASAASAAGGHRRGGPAPLGHGVSLDEGLRDAEASLMGGRCARRRQQVACCRAAACEADTLADRISRLSARLLADQAAAGHADVTRHRREAERPSPPRVRVGAAGVQRVRGGPLRTATQSARVLPNEARWSYPVLLSIIVALPRSFV